MASDPEAASRPDLNKFKIPKKKRTESESEKSEAKVHEKSKQPQELFEPDKKVTSKPTKSHQEVESKAEAIDDSNDNLMIDESDSEPEVKIAERDHEEEASKKANEDHK